MPFSARHALPILAFLLAATGHAGETLLVEESVSLVASPAKVWKLAGSFAGLGNWYPGVAKVAITSGRNNRKGAVRVVTLKDGVAITEELLDYQAAQKSLSYRITESPLPVKNYQSTFRVEAEGSGSRVTWSSRFEQDPAAKLDAAQTRQLIAGIYTNGFAGLQEKLAVH